MKVKSSVIAVAAACLFAALAVPPIENAVGNESQSLPPAAEPLRPGPDPALLRRLEPGRWELRDVRGDTLIAQLCLGNPALLIQARHPEADCVRREMAGEGDRTTVHYSCRGTGSGRTTLRYETPRLVQVESQGIDRGVPFGFRAEARRMGDCASAD